MLNEPVVNSSPPPAPVNSSQPTWYRSPTWAGIRIIRPHLNSRPAIRFVRGSLQRPSRPMGSTWANAQGYPEAAVWTRAPTAVTDVNRRGLGVRSATPQQFLLTDFRTGVTVGLTSPKTLIFLSALLPAFVPSGTSTVPQMLLLGTIFAAVAVAGDSVWAIAAGTARAWFTQIPRRIGRLRTAGGAIQIGLGTYTVATGAKL